MTTPVTPTRDNFKLVSDLYRYGDDLRPGDAATAAVDFLDLPCVWEYEGDSFTPTCIYELEDGYVAVTCSGFDLSETGTDFTGTASEFLH